MNHHFGIALGVITVTVVGGALLLDYTTKAPEKTASLATPPAAVTESTTSTASVSSTNGAGEATPTVTDARTAGDEVSSRAPASPSSQEVSGKAAKSSSKRTASSRDPNQSNDELLLRPAPSTTVPNVETKSLGDPAFSTGEPSANSKTAAGDKPSVEPPPKTSGTVPPTAPPKASSENADAASPASTKEGEKSESSK